MTHIERLRELACGGVVTRSAAVLAGVPDRFLRKMVERGTLARIARGVYAVGTRDLESPLVLTLRHKVVLGHASAAAFHGAELPEPVNETHVIASRNRGRRRRDITDARLHRANLRADEIVTIRGVRVTSALRTAIDIARTSPIEFSVPVIDSFLRIGSFSVEEFASAARGAGGRASSQVRLASGLMDPESGSVLESMTRVLLWKHRLVMPISQFTLRHRASGWWGRLDFAWPDLKLALECDGFEFHSGRDEFKRDRRRWNALTRLGWRLLVITWTDLREDPDYVIDLVRELIASQTQQHTLGIVTSLKAA